MAGMGVQMRRFQLRYRRRVLLRAVPDMNLDVLVGQPQGGLIARHADRCELLQAADIAILLWADKYIEIRAFSTAEQRRIVRLFRCWFVSTETGPRGRTYLTVTEKGRRYLAIWDADRKFCAKTKELALRCERPAVFHHEGAEPT